jgi:CDP-diacylglycerol--glycerol-3-phosphate 3-phosphatidyltransferase
MMWRLISYKNLPNMLSALRMTLVLPFVLAIHDIFVYECAKNLALVILFVLILLSDIADGCAARKLNCSSKTGAALDVLSDALYTLFSFGMFAYFKLVPAWFVLVLLFKLLEFMITSKVLGKRRNQGGALVFDKIGKLSVIITMLLPGVFVFRCMILEYKTVMNAAVYVITALLALSTIGRINRTRR